MKSFKNKIVVITGGSSGLGLALAKLLASKGARLVLVARDSKKIAQACQNVLDVTSNASVHGISVDVTDQTSLSSFYSEVQKKYGTIDILINSAGILKEGYFENLSENDFRHVMDVNYFGLLSVIKTFLPMLKQSHGRIVNISSVAGLEGVFGFTPYCASKHAVVGLTKSLYYELKPQGVTVQMVFPPEFDSPMVDKLNIGRTPENTAHVLMIPHTSVQSIAKGVIKGMRTKDLTIFPTPITAASAWSARHFPSISKMLVEQKIRAVYQGP